MARDKKRKRPEGSPSGRVKKSVTLPAELARALEVYAASQGVEQSQIVARALEPVLAGFYWARKGSIAEKADQPQPPSSLAA